MSLDRDNAAGRLLDQMANLRAAVIDKLGHFAAEIDPQPASLSIFGSFARGVADARSDLDVLAVRCGSADGERWARALSEFAGRARSLTGNSVELLDYDLDELRRKTSTRSARVGDELWASICRDAVTLVGSRPQDLLKAARGTAR